MNKGVFYLLPFLALSQVVASNPLPQVEVANLLNVLERVRSTEAPKNTVMMPKPISGRNIRTIDGQRVKVLKPRAGRNASRLKGRLLIRRQ